MNTVSTSSAIVLLVAVLMWPGSAASEQDPFDGLATQLSRAACIHIRFLHIVESQIFNDVDSLPGSAVIDQNGRYRIELPNDEFVCDGTFIHSYSRPNNQVVIEKAGPAGSSARHDLLFLAHLKDYYDITPVDTGSTYRLTMTDSRQTTLPDSMVAFVTGNPARLDYFDYFDINEDRNRLIIESLSTERPCHDSLFAPTWPDSVDRVKL